MRHTQQSEGQNDSSISIPQARANTQLYVFVSLKRISDSWSYGKFFTPDTVTATRPIAANL